MDGLFGVLGLQMGPRLVVQPRDRLHAGRETLSALRGPLGPEHRQEALSRTAGRMNAAWSECLVVLGDLTHCASNAETGPRGPVSFGRHFFASSCV